jgi:cytochrome b561
MSAIARSGDFMNQHYTRTAIALHWIIGVLVVTALVIGLVMTDMHASPAKLQAFSWHKWIGITVLALFFVRALWRLTHPAPAPLPMPDWQRYAAQAGHLLLYLLLLVQPLTGWLYSSAAGHPVVWFGLLPLPDLVAKNAALAPSLRELHETCAWLLVTVIALHVLAALKHHYVDHDDTLRRMLRWRAS